MLRIGCVLTAACLMWMALARGTEGPGEPRLFPIAPVESLLGREAGPAALHVLVLPDGSAVVLRPLSPEEYGAFQIRAVAPEVIEREMLASCIVLPRVTPGEVGNTGAWGLIKWAINAVSGFTVFPDVPPVPRCCVP